MLGAIAFSLLCAAAAWSAEQALSAWRRPTRWPWVAAMLAAAIVEPAASVGGGSDTSPATADAASVELAATTTPEV